MNFLSASHRMFRLTSTLVGGTLWLALMGGYYTLVHRPLEGRVAAQQVRIEKLDALLRDGAAVYQSHRELTTQLRELNEQIETVRARVPEQPLEAIFLSSATKIAEEEALEIVNFRRQTTRDFADYSEVEVVIQGQGSYASVCRFLDRVNQLPRLSTVRRMTLGSAANDDAYPFEVTYSLQYGMNTSASQTNTQSKTASNSSNPGGLL